jgi:hypothetical protein
MIPFMPSPYSKWATAIFMRILFICKLLSPDCCNSIYNSNKFKISTSAFTPAYCSTSIFSKADSPSLRSDPIFYFLICTEKIIAIPVEEGAATGVWLANATIASNDLGGYWDRCVRRISGANMMSEALLKRLWERWCRYWDKVESNIDIV